MQCNYSIATRQSNENPIITYTQFDASSGGDKIWNDLKQNGKFKVDDIEDNTKGNYLAS